METARCLGATRALAIGRPSAVLKSSASGSARIIEFPERNEIRNPKAEIRKKSETRSPNQTSQLVAFGFRPSAFFWISVFGFRILRARARLSTLNHQLKYVSTHSIRILSTGRAL